MKKLPIGYSSLVEIVNDECVYIDKTKFVNRLTSQGKYYFLSRPRRFGKSLFIDTLKQAFLANKEIFKGLFLENNWDWNTKYPVLHFDFGEGTIKQVENLASNIQDSISSFYEQYGIENTHTKSTIESQLKFLIQKLHAKYDKKVVLLIDEYDKPILDNIDDKETAAQMREALKNLYSVIKTQDANLKFVFLSGVTKFNRVSLFSGLNNLRDISLSSQYADICGYTQAELESSFAQYLAHGKVNLAKLKLWYNGYNFDGIDTQKVYNPFDVLLFFIEDYNYKKYWFETATPQFLIKMLKERKYYTPNFENLTLSDSDLGSFEITKIPLYALLFQSGYLTIKKAIKFGGKLGYELSYPNLEVKASLNESLMELISGDEERSEYEAAIISAINTGNLDSFKGTFSSILAGIPYDWQKNSDMSKREGYYASIVYSYLCALGYELIGEDTTNQGRIDLTIKTDDKIIIIEFKINKYGDAKSALQQIKDKKYAEKYLEDKKDIYLVGMSFDIESKNIDGLEWLKIWEHK